LLRPLPESLKTNVATVEQLPMDERNHDGEAFSSPDNAPDTEKEKNVKVTDKANQRLMLEG
jgi:hypothetical protein